MNQTSHKYLSRQICHRLAAMLLAFASVLPPLAARAEKANVFFIHGANVSEQNARAWAAEMFKRLWQAGANMEFHPVAWESDIGPSYNYQVNVSNAFVTASRLAPHVNSIPGRRVVIAHSLGTMVAAAAIQDQGMQVEKLIMLNSAIPSAAFDPSLADARIVAVGNGNPRAMESFADPSAHSLFFGKAVVVVRRDAPGAITLVAAAEQLETAKMVMQSPRPARK